MSDSTLPTVVPPPNINDAYVVAGGYLARFGATTRRSYASDLKSWFEWCSTMGIGVLGVTRPQLEASESPEREAQENANQAASSTTTTTK